TNPALPGSLASASCDRPMVAGGWSSFGARQASRPNTPLIPAGACLFMAGGSGAPSRTRIGERTEWGFGAIAWGNGW
ncbi:MAG: type III-B CRISPR module-associated Cmr3 family protein, partial [Hyphomicrobiaceae bacterium]